MGRRCAVALGAAAAVVSLLSGCGLGEFEDQTAVVTVDGVARTYDIDSCGLDERTIFVVAHDDDGAIVQAVMGLEPEGGDGIAASTGLTLDADPDRVDTRQAAFGAEAWARRGSTGAPPGSIGAARLRGSRIQFDGEVVAVDAADRPVPDAAAVAFTFDARCDLEE